MRFEGVIRKHYDVDWGEYWRDYHKFSNIRIVTESEYKLESYTFYAEVYGRFGDDFCSGANPLLIKEYDDKPEVMAEIPISHLLWDRLVKDNQSTEIELYPLFKMLGG